MNSLKPSLSWFLVFCPITVGLHYLRPDDHTWIFISACLAILPLAGWLGRATEHLAERTSEGIGGLLNATFGNAAELIIALSALHQGYFDIVKASLTGSIIGNVLLVLGLSFLAGGIKRNEQTFNAVGAQTQSTMLLLAAIALILPAVFHHLVGDSYKHSEQSLSLEIAVVLLVTYGFSLLFTLRTHKQLFSATGSTDEADEADEPGHGPSWSLGKSFTVLLSATAAIAWMSEILVGSVQHAATTFGMTNTFVGVIVVAIVGNAAEHSTAILMAMKNRMDLSLGIAIGSSIQIALFVAPLLVIASYFIAPQPMNLVFSGAEVLAVTVSVWIVSQISNDGKSNWFEGLQLLTVYVLLGLIFYFLPDRVGMTGH